MLLRRLAPGVVGHVLEVEEVHLAFRHRREAALAAAAEKEMPPVDFARPRDRQAPARLPGEARAGRLGEEELAHAGADAVRADDEIVAILRAVAEGCGDPGFVLADRCHRNAETHFDA